MQSLVEIGSVVLEKKIFKNLVSVFSLYCCNLPFNKGFGRSFEKKINFLHTRILCANLDENESDSENESSEKMSEKNVEH